MARPTLSDEAHRRGFRQGEHDPPVRASASAFLNAREEAVPGDYRGDRGKGVLLVVVGRDQSSADAGVKADLLVDGAAIGLEGAGMPLVGLTEHRPDQSVEQVDCLVRQARSRATATKVACRRWRS